MATSFQRSEFEQLLSTQLLQLSEVVELLADRVIALDEDLARIEAGLHAVESGDGLSLETGELLMASEHKVQVLRDRLALVPDAVETERQPEPESEMASEADQEMVEEAFMDDGFDQLIA
ncbi:MAG: hypothetical protein ACPHAS_06970 [Synechococcus sp.]